MLIGRDTLVPAGTSSIVHETTHQPLLTTLSSIVETVLRLRNNGHKVVLVSSGAIGVGLKRMEIPARPKSLAKKQALAAVGQGRLIALWDNLFGQLGQPIAQVLLTRGDISDRTRYLNAVNTLSELLSMGVVPIINENDTISVSEIRFGDNDTLSAITASMLHADYLFLLTDVDSLYTSNPRKDPSAKAIDVVSSIAAIRTQVSTATLGSQLGTGGMETKLIAAEIATSAGVSTVITTSKHPENIFHIIEYALSTAPGTSTPAMSPTSGAQSRAATPPPDPNPNNPQLPTLTRPPHTLFLPSASPLSDLKSWTSHTLAPAGSVIVDMGAYRVLSRRDSGGRLLAAGVLAVQGSFASGQAVRILVRQHPAGTTGSFQSMDSAATILDSLPLQPNSSLPVDTSPTVSRPITPMIIPESMSSSISSIDNISRQASLISISEAAHRVTIPPTVAELEEGSSHHDPEGTDAEWEHIEVGRGLANYNSVEIRKVRGAKSSQLATLLGYADSEYVVENITIRVLPRA
ncbi:glutamate 5-kinase [Clavulina sp. PMI_390]|nr:glutamate 5-kinase [Clavulina sp. PMI_390]